MLNNSSTWNQTCTKEPFQGPEHKLTYPLGSQITSEYPFWSQNLQKCPLSSQTIIICLPWKQTCAKEPSQEPKHMMNCCLGVQMTLKCPLKSQNMHESPLMLAKLHLVVLLGARILT